MRKFLFRVTGGLGRNIIATAVIRQIKKDNPDSIIRVIASYPDVFTNNPHISRVYPYTQQGPDFRDANIDFDVLEAEPYYDLAYRQGKEHIVDVWCRRLGLSAPEKLTGELFLTDEEIQWAELQRKRINTQSPIVAFQPFGGISSYNPNDAQDILRPKQIRSLPIKVAQEIADELQKKGLMVIQLSLPTEPRLERVMFLEAGNGQVLSNRLVFATLNACDNLISIDSFAMHAWVALGKKNAISTWGSTNPTNLGYSCNTNLSLPDKCGQKFCNRPDGHFFDVDGSGRPWQCPHKGICMNFDPKEIVSAVMASVEVKKENGNA